SGLLSRIISARIQPDLGKINEEIDAFDKGAVLRLGVNVYDAAGEIVTSPALSIEPDEVEYRMSVVPSAAIRVLRVLPDYTGLPLDGHMLANIASNPKYISVPASLARSDLFTLRTDAIDLEGKSKSFIAKPQLQFPFSIPAGIELPNEVEVTVEILELAEDGSGGMALNVEVKGGLPGYEFVVTPPQIKIVSERLSLLPKAQRSEITASVAADGLKPGDYRIAPQLRLLDGLDDAQIIPHWVTLTVIEKGR
ncbi:MAG: hypothetical protein M3R04_05950, partial [bacterium]|nr:hypothetical protein [bacterium]